MRQEIQKTGECDITMVDQEDERALSEYAARGMWLSIGRAHYS